MAKSPYPATTTLTRQPRGAQKGSERGEEPTRQPRARGLPCNLARPKALSRGPKVQRRSPSKRTYPASLGHPSTTWRYDTKSKPSVYMYVHISSKGHRKTSASPDAQPGYPAMDPTYLSTVISPEARLAPRRPSPPATRQPAARMRLFLGPALPSSLASPSGRCRWQTRKWGECLYSTKLAAGLRSVARNNKATRLLTRPG